LILAADGNFYGTSPNYGGTSTACYFGCGNVFQMTPQGTMSMITAFALWQTARMVNILRR